MKEFVARQTHGGTYKWHGSFVSGEEAREHGIRFGIHISSLVREAAVRQVAADLADLGEDWLHPMGSPDGLWLIHLDKVVTVFPSLTEQQWLKGDRFLEPEFDIIESSIALGKPVCLLKDSTLQALPTDLVGRLYESFDVQRVDETIPKVLHRWLHEKGLALDGG